MNDTNLTGAWGSLAGALHLLFLRMPGPDPRRIRVNTDAMVAGDRALQAIGQDDDALEAKLLKLAGRVTVLDHHDHAAFSTLMDEIEAKLAD